MTREAREEASSSAQQARKKTYKGPTDKNNTEWASPLPKDAGVNSKP